MRTFKSIDVYQEKINDEEPFEGDNIKQIQDYYRIGLTYSSNSTYFEK